LYFFVYFSGPLVHLCDRHKDGFDIVRFPLMAAPAVAPPVRIAVVVGKMVGGGVESSVMNHYRHLDKSRVQFDFIVDADSSKVPLKEIERSGGRVFVIPPCRHVVTHVLACRRVFASTSPDIVHSHINALSVFPLLSARLAGVPIRIAHSHSASDPGEPLRNAVKSMLKTCSRLFPTHLAACSHHAASWLFGGRRRSLDDVHIVRNAIDLAEFTFSPRIRNRQRDALNLSPQQFTVACIGRLCTQKNQTFAFKVFAGLLSQVPEAVLLVAGDGPMLVELRRLARDLHIDHAVRFLGVRDHISAIYQACDALLFPSLYEGLGMAVIEAQATGLPVLASTAIPAEACIVPGAVERLPLRSDITQWSEHLANIATRQRMVTEFERNGHSRELASAGYDIRQSAESLCRWYQSLAAEGQSQRSLESRVPVHIASPSANCRQESERLDDGHTDERSDACPDAFPAIQTVRRS
jgi:glycosyltransferase involved in cell wall biosynthesis